MTALDQVTALVKAHVHRDEAQFRTITLQIAARAASKSEQAALRLRELVNQQQPAVLKPLPSASALLSIPPDSATLQDMVLAPSVKSMMDRIILEHTQRMMLSVHGLRPASKLLFCGPPGTGKTMAAKALAHALRLPLFRIELHSVIASRLGETAANLAQVFTHVRDMQAVYLFDEFDALGMSRSANTDGAAAGAEMRRTVNTLLQLIEDDRSDGLLIAATNHQQVLDPALFRRFDEVVTFPALTTPELTTLIDRELVGFDTGTLDYEALHAVNPSLGHSDLCAVLHRLCKDHVIMGTPINTESLIEGIQRRFHTSPQGDA